MVRELITGWLRSWLDRRQRDESQVVIEDLRERVEALETAFEPIVARFPDQDDLRAMLEDKRQTHRIQIGEFSPYELHRARAVLHWEHWHTIEEPSE